VKSADLSSAKLHRHDGLDCECTEERIKRTEVGLSNRQMRFSDSSGAIPAWFGDELIENCSKKPTHLGWQVLSGFTQHRAPLMVLLKSDNSNSLPSCSPECITLLDLSQSQNRCIGGREQKSTRKQ
jgi:hypothetical protein